MAAPASNVPVVGYGTIIGKTSGTVVAMVTSISGLDVKADHYEITAFDTANGYKTFVSGLKDAGEVTIQGHFNSAAHASMFSTDMNVVGATATTNYTITFADKVGTVTTATTWAFNAFITNYKTDFQVNGVVKFEAKFKVTGQPTLTAAV